MRTKRILQILAVTALVMGLSLGVAYGWPSSDPGTGGGTPPNGVANANSYADDAKGTRVSGVLFIEYIDYDFQANYTETARVTLRLRKGNQLAAFHTVVTGEFSPKLYPGVVVDDIVAAMSDDVIAVFGGTDDVRVKEVSEFINLRPERSAIMRDDPLGGVPVIMENCVNGLDDDGDTWIDDVDPDCALGSAIIVTDVILSIK